MLLSVNSTNKHTSWHEVSCISFCQMQRPVSRWSLEVLKLKINMTGMFSWCSSDESCWFIIRFCIESLRDRAATLQTHFRNRESVRGIGFKQTHLHSTAVRLRWKGKVILTSFFQSNDKTAFKTMFYFLNKISVYHWTIRLFFLLVTKLWTSLPMAVPTFLI